MGASGLRLLAERYLGGRLLFAAAEGTGTRSTLCLPAPEPLTEPAPSPREETVADPGSPLPERAKLGTVLVVDDMKVTRHLVQAILAKDFSVVLAENGKEAIALASEQSPDLIVLDVVMPEMDGYAVCGSSSPSPGRRTSPSSS